MAKRRRKPAAPLPGAGARPPILSIADFARQNTRFERCGLHVTVYIAAHVALRRGVRTAKPALLEVRLWAFRL